MSCHIFIAYLLVHLITNEVNQQVCDVYVAFSYIFGASSRGWAHIPRCVCPLKPVDRGRSTSKNFLRYCVGVHIQGLQQCACTLYMYVEGLPSCRGPSSKGDVYFQSLVGIPLYAMSLIMSSISTTRYPRATLSRKAGIPRPCLAKSITFQTFIFMLGVKTATLTSMLRVRLP